MKLSDRGLGTELRTDPVFLGLQKTRLLDPILSLPGTNDHPGDYRNSGCTACHVIYANDRSPVHSGPYAKYGNQAHSAQIDPTIPQNESGHPIKHEFTRSIPTSQCIVCHIHPGTNMVASYLGYIWWDNETDGEHMYPEEAAQSRRMRSASSPGRRIRKAPRRAGCGRISRSSKKSGRPEFNKQLKHTQFADFHGHGWVFRAVYKRDRKGNLLDAGEQHGCRPTTRTSFKKRCSCATSISKKACTAPTAISRRTITATAICTARRATRWKSIAWIATATISHKATLRTSAAAAPEGGTDMSLLRTPWGQRRFYWQDGKLYQRSMVDKDRAPWEVVQVVDTITPGNPHYNEKSRLAKTMLKDGTTWGACRRDESKLAHANEQHDLLHVPLLLDHQLLRLPSADDRQSQSCRCCTTKG